MNNLKTIIFFITLFIFCVVLVYPVQLDYDLWARLVAGMSVVENGKVLMHDFYSYTPTNPVWFDHEWGASVIFYWVTTLSDFFHKSKLEMLIFLQQTLIFMIITLSVLCVKIRKPKFSVPYQILYFCLAALSAKIVFVPTVRCHLFTFAFFALWLLILESYRIYNKKYLLFLLPPLMLFWANIHGGCLSGLGLLIIYAVGEALNKKNYKPYLITLAASFAMLFINPYGPDYVKFLFTAGTMNRNLIQEWQSLFTLHWQAIKFILYFIFMSAIFATQIVLKKNKFKNYDKTKLILLLVTGCLAAMHAKLIPFFVITSSVFLFDDVFEITDKNRFFKWLNNPENKYVYGIILLLAAFCCQIFIPLQHYYVNLGKYPFRAVEFIKQKRVEGNLFVDMTYGSFCAYKLYPQNKVFMDGRYEEVYSPALLEQMKNFAKQDGDNPMAVINNYPTDIALLYIGTKPKPPYYINLQKLGWKPIYKDFFWAVMVRPDYPYSDELYVYGSEDNKTNFDFNNEEYFYTNLFDTNITKDLIL